MGRGLILERHYPWAVEDPSAIVSCTSRLLYAVSVVTATETAYFQAKAFLVVRMMTAATL